MLLLLCAGLFSWLLLKFMNDDAQRRLEHREATEKGCQSEDELPQPDKVPEQPKQVTEPCREPAKCEPVPKPVEHIPCHRVEPEKCYEPIIAPIPEPERPTSPKPLEREEPEEIKYPTPENNAPICCPGPEKKVEEPTVTQPSVQEPEDEPELHVEPEEVYQQEYHKPLENCPVLPRQEQEPKDTPKPNYEPKFNHEPCHQPHVECCDFQGSPESVQEPETRLETPEKSHPEEVFALKYHEPEEYSKFIPQNEPVALQKHCDQPHLKCCELQEHSNPVQEPESCPEIPEKSHLEEVFALKYVEPEEYCQFIPQREAVIVPVPKERTTQPESWSTFSESGSEFSSTSSSRTPAHEGYQKVLEELREKHCERPEVLEMLTLTRDIRNSVSNESDLSSCSATSSESDSEDDRVVYSFRRSPAPSSLESAPSEDKMQSCDSESDDEDIVIEFRKAEILTREPEVDPNNNTIKKAVDPVFVAPPPPHQEMEKLPFICRLNKTVSADEYGFNLHAEKNRGHFIGAVDHGGIGDEAGLKMGQRIVGVNDVLIHPTTPYKEVVSIIKKSPMSTTLLVAPEDVDKWYKANNQSYSWDHAIEGAAASNGHIEEEIIHEEEKQFSPHSIQISDEEIHVESPIPPKYDVPPPIEDEHLASHVVSAQYDLPPMDNTTPVIDSANILDAVFGGLAPSETLVLAPQIEEYSHHHEEVPEPVEQKELIQHPGHEQNEETPIVDDRNATYNPYNGYNDVSQASPISNGSSSQSSQGSLSPGHGRDDFGIYGLSAQQARERLRQSKPRAAVMSLEEKYRLVSNM